MADDKQMDDKLVNDGALDGLSVAPPDPDADQDGETHIQDPRQEAGQDASIARRLERDPESKEAQLDNALDESMDASDPPASTQPGSASEPPRSSGYDPEAERGLRGA